MKSKTVTVFGSPQFTCPFCGKGYNQRSKLLRHTQTAHPPTAPSAADVERVFKGIKYPKTKQELFEIATRRLSTSSPDLLGIIDSLPKRNYRDSAEVAIALGEIKSGKKPRSASEMSKLETPSKKGGRRALSSKKISASRISRALKGITFPKSKRGIMKHVKGTDDSNKEEIISILQRIPDKKFERLVEVVKEVAMVK